MSEKLISKVTAKLQKAVTTGSARALNKAVSQANTAMKSAIRKDTGLPNKEISKRIILKKARADKLRASLHMAIKLGIPLGKFSPSVRSVRVTPVNSSKRRKYYGVTVKIGPQPRTLVPGGFLAIVRNGQRLVLSRYAYIGKLKGPRGGTTYAPTTKVFIDSVNANKDAVSEGMVEAFDNRVGAEVKFALSQIK